MKDALIRLDSEVVHELQQLKLRSAIVHYGLSRASVKKWLLPAESLVKQ